MTTEFFKIQGVTPEAIKEYAETAKKQLADINTTKGQWIRRSALERTINLLCDMAESMVCDSQPQEPTS